MHLESAAEHARHHLHTLCEATPIRAVGSRQTRYGSLGNGRTRPGWCT
ncbi:MAG: hypothetical protein AB1453_06045 [Chloroflexota bacterium]|jgi:hypothetical protein